MVKPKKQSKAAKKLKIAQDERKALELLEIKKSDIFNEIEEYPDTSEIMSTDERIRQNAINKKNDEVFTPKKSVQMIRNPENIEELKKSFLDIDVEMIDRTQLKFEKPPQEYRLFNIAYQHGSRFDKTYHAMLFDEKLVQKQSIFLLQVH